MMRSDRRITCGRTLTDHYDRHGKAMGYANETEYLEGARAFLDGYTTESTLYFTNSTGTYFKYDQITNEFGIINQYGGISTYYKPLEGYNYWIDQVNKYSGT